MKPTRVSIYAILGLTCVFTSGCRGSQSDKPETMPPVKVKVVAVADGDYNSALPYSGTVQSATSTTVSFSVPGTIAELYASEGQSVAKGAKLGKLTAGDYEYANNMAQAELAQARDGYERLKKLHDSNSLPEVKWVDIQQKLKQAENAAAIAERALNETTLVSPVAGVVSRKIASAGENVAPIQPVYEIVSTNDLTIDISIPEGDIDHIKVGDKAVVEFNVASVGTTEGRVTEKAVVADPLTRTYKVKVSLPAEVSGKVFPGMVGTVKLAAFTVDETGKAAVMLPSQAVVLGNDNRTFVWIVRNGKAERQFVTVNELIAGGVAVEEGLQRGDTVIVEGMQKVGTGSAVEPIIK